MPSTHRTLKRDVSTKNLRHGKYFIHYLSQRQIPLYSGNQSTPDGCCAIINNSLNNHFKSSHDIHSFIEDMEISCNIDLINISNFDWLQNNERACYWAWGYLKTAKEQDLGYPHPKSSITIYEQLNLVNNPTSTKERFDVIVSFFDTWGELTQYKSSFLQTLKRNWE